MSTRVELLSKLNQEIKSHIRYDNLTRGLYATDASIYQIIPEAVIVVKCESDLPIILNFAKKHDFKILARGAATSLAGQTVAHAIVLDFSKYLNKLVSLDVGNKTVVVQPGIILSELNDILKTNELQFAPDPATANRATIGGMIANNSSGTKSILYGKTSDHLISLKVLLEDGSIVIFEDKSEDAYEAICEQNDKEGEIYRRLRSIIFEHADEIRNRFPIVMRRVSGYALDAFIETKKWNLCNLICGSEGTLGIILEAKLNLITLPKYKGICLIHFDDRFLAIRSVKNIVEYGPSSVEMLDKNVLIQSKINLSTNNLYQRVVSGEPEALLICEFFADTESLLHNKLNLLQKFLANKTGVIASPVYTGTELMNSVWTLRKNGLGLIMGTPGDKKPIPFIEDSAIPLENLADYIEEISDYCQKINISLVLYAHASVGVLHIRPFLNLRIAEDIEKMKMISKYAAQLVQKYEGSLSGEHGDGLVRSSKLQLFFGAEIMACFKEIKMAFDPSYMFNPNKKVDALPMDQHLKYGTSYKELGQEFVFQYRNEKSFETIVNLCSGISACRKIDTEGMCPSYRATKDEQDSPRGRANALRLIMSGQLEGLDMLSDELQTVLSLCLSCKACKSECPSNVDIAKLKAEVMQLRHTAGKTTLMQYMIANSHRMAKVFSGALAPIVNNLLQRTWVKSSMQKLIGIDKRRNMPSYARYSLMHYYKHNKEADKPNAKTVVLYADTFINYHEPNIGISAYHLLLACGYNVIIAEVGCCQRPKISNGFLKDAKQQGSQTAIKLQYYLDKGFPILVCEPSCGSALMDDLPDLIDDGQLASKMKKGISLIDEYLFHAIETGALSGRFEYDHEHVVMHTHCHQAALHGIENSKNICSNSNINIESENLGCCGMGGALGYEKKYFDFSRKVATRNLLPKLKEVKDDSLLVANGTSCRHQIHDLSNKNAKHWVEVVRYVSKEKLN